MTVVSAGARLHIGFQNLSLARARLYGGIGVGLEQPRVTVRAEPAEAVAIDTAGTDDRRSLREYAERVVACLDVPGVSLTLEETLARHIGLGSGTQLALAMLVATAGAYDREVDVRAYAPQLGRGGRSGVGVGTFEAGGFVVDAGHPTSRFTTEPPPEGDWTVPPVVARHELPAAWRFVVILPNADPGRSGDDEESGLRTVVEHADPTVADEIAGVLTRKLLPAAAEGSLEAFGAAITEIGQKNGSWYADLQGGVFRPPAGALVEAVSACPVVSGVGQSSWGPAVYGLTDATHVEEARQAALDALEQTGFDGRVVVTAPSSCGATIAD